VQDVGATEPVAQPAEPEQPGGTSATAIATVAAYDPDGDGTENNADAPNVIDGDLASTWSTQCYSDQYFGGKGGVGLAVTLDGSGTGTLTLDIASAPWILEVYAVDGESLPTGIAAWGSAIARDDARESGTISVPIETPARHMLVLLRQGGRSPACSNEFPFRASISEIGFEATP
jgi:hypothetical protein